MSYQEKRTGASILSGILVLAAYCIYAFGKSASGVVAAGDLKFWASTMLIFIGIGIGATIIIQVLFHILLSISIAVRAKIHDQNCDEKEIDQSINAEMVEDERDRLVELKSLRVGFIIAGVGFVAALFSVVLGYATPVMLNIIFLSFMVGSLFEGAAQLYYYRRGV